MQTTLLGLAIAFILALIAALIGPYFIDWNQFRTQFEAEATRVVGAPVHVEGKLDARLLPTPSLQLRSLVVGSANDLGKIRADKLDVEFSLGSLMRGEWRATELTINELGLDLGLDPQGRIEWPASTGKFNLGSLAIDRLNLTGRIALHDAVSHGTVELDDIAFSGDVRSLAGAIRGDGNFMLSGARYPFRVFSSQTTDGSGTHIHFNIDPGTRALAADLDGVLSFEARAPRFDGAVTLAASAGSKTKSDGDDAPAPWRITSKVKADSSVARFEQVEASYGPEDRALKFLGSADLRFGASPLLHAVLSARQLDADRFLARDGDKPAAPKMVWPGLRALMAVMPQAPLATQLEVSAEQITLGGRPVQNLMADLRADARSDSSADHPAGYSSWKINRLDLRAPGSTHVSLTGTAAPGNSSGSFKAALNVESSDPDTLQAWLQGRSEITYRNQKPLRVRGDVSVTSDSVALDAMQAELDGEGVQGRLAVSNWAAGGTRVEADLKAAHLDLDSAMSLTRAMAGPQAGWPQEVSLALDIGRATLASQELRPFIAKLAYGPETISLDQLKVGDAKSVLVEGTGSIDRANTSGKLSLNANAVSLSQITGLVAPFAPGLAARFDAMGAASGPAVLKMTFDLDKDSGRKDHALAHGVFDLDSPQLKGVTALTAKPDISALRALDIDKLRHSDIDLQSNLSSEKSASLLALLGLDHVVASSESAAQFQISAAGAWPAPLRLSAKLSGDGLDADAQGTMEPWASEHKASVNLTVHRINLAPLFDLKSSDALTQNISLFSRVSIAGNRLTFDSVDSHIAGSRLRGRMAVTLANEKTGDPKNIEGEIGLDTLDLASAFALALGASGREATEPLGSGLLNGWRGRVAFQALRGSLPGGGELRPISGAVKSDGQSLTLEGIKGQIGGGEMSATIDAKPTASGTVLNARVQLTDVNGAELHYRDLAMPAGRASLQMTLASQGRSASALSGALSGSGTVTLKSAEIAGLDISAFDVAILASDSGQAVDDAHLRSIVEPVLSSGKLAIPSADIPFSIRDGRLRVGATTLQAEGARAVISGGYDIAADQADIRVSLVSTMAAPTTSPAEIQLFANGSPDTIHRTVDVAALSSWLAVRAIDRETRRLDSIERGEPPAPKPASAPALAPAPSPANGSPSDAPDAVSSVPPNAYIAPPRRFGPKLKPATPRPVGAASVPSGPVVSQRVAPLPPPIEIRPAPGAVKPPKPRPQFRAQPFPLRPPPANPLP